MTNLRVGIGHDTHRLGPGRPLILGGVSIPHEQGLIGHSDADVVLHALADALLGAVGRGDIGEWFPDTDPANKDLDSRKLLREIHTKAVEPARVVNVDCIVFAQKPKLGPHKQAIRESIASLLGIPAENVNVKAKTGEQVGPIGRQEAISAEVAVLVEHV
ncbi:MAG: 2-C-methyl-D-erythritol 2,4-cyclodiphosphate synthase [Planctomycetota bacterium]